MNWVERGLSAALLAGSLGASPGNPAGGPAGEDAWPAIQPGIELHYPRDHGAHPGYKTEWWYLTGQVSDEAGREFGFQFTVFRNALVSESTPVAGSSRLRARQLYFGHLALVDIEAQRTTFAERTRRAGTPLAGASLTDLNVVLDDWSLVREAVPRGEPGEPGAGDASGSRERLLVRASDPGSGIGIDLLLEPAKPLVLHGERGYSAKGPQPGNASAYASWTRLTTRGSLTCGGVEHSVRGASWFDHEHGSSVLGADVVGWDWFGLQLDDGRELMLFGLRAADGTLAASSGGTLVETDGSPRALRRDEFSWQVGARWRSPRTGAQYPARWTIGIPGAGLELELTPRVADCELVTEESTGVVYWEGPVTVEGTHGGRGYAELTGYSGSMSGRF